MKILWRPLFLISPVLPVVLYFRGAWYDLTEAYSLSMLLGIPAYVYLMNCLILSSRLKCLDRIAGHDRVMVFHRQLAGAALILALLHGIIKSQVFPLSFMPAPLGSTAFVIALATGLGAAFFLRDRSGRPGREKPDYCFIKSLHNLSTIAAILAAVHVLLASSTYEQGSRMVLMGLWAVISLALWVRHKLIRPLILTERNNRVIELRALNDDTCEITMDRKGFGNFRAGQFVYLRFPYSRSKGEEHPFTISSAPADKDLVVTVKALGDFTEGLKSLKNGDPVIIDGPYGRLCTDTSGPLIFLAGGIGITPFISALRDILPDCRFPVALFWSVRYQSDLVYEEELRCLESQYTGFTYCPTLTGLAVSGSEQGRIDQDMILRHTDRQMRAQALWYCCGPSSMMDAMDNLLREMGIPGNRIRKERFTY